jgi:uncharacterized membrane protein
MSNQGETQGKSNVPLIISLSLNFLLAGLIAMALVRVFMFHPMFGPGMGPGFGGGHGMGHGRMMVQQMLSPHEIMRLVPAERGKIRAIMEANASQIETLRSASLDARADVLRAFAAPQFNKNAFEQALARMQSADAALEIAALRVVSESAATLSPVERKLVAAQAGDGPRLWMRRQERGF